MKRLHFSIKTPFHLSFILGLILFSFTNFAIGQNINFTEEEKAWIKDHPVIYHGYEPNWPPYEIYENGEYSGIIGEYVKILERETGLQIEPIPNITWEESIKGLKSGEVDFTVCAGITDERKEFLNFTEPYISSPMVIVSRKDEDFVGGLEDLRKKSLALPKGYYTAELISKDYPNIKIDFKNGIEESLRAVSMGEADAFVGNLVVVSYYIEHKGYSNLKIAAPTDYEKTHIGLAARKDWPELVSISQKVFSQISYVERNEILQRWMNVRYEYGVKKAEVIKYGLYIGLVVLLAFLIILGWNKSLKKEISKRVLVEEELELALLDAKKISEERKILLQEVHHRVKNNLQIIVSLLRLQSDDDKRLNYKLQESITRIKAISLVHEKVYSTENLANITLKKYIESLTNEIVSSFEFENPPKLKVVSNIGEVDIKPLIPLGLILNELITNSLKYGFKDMNNGEIIITIKQEKGSTMMSYFDNGVWIEPKSGSKSFGHTLIEVFSAQLEGNYERVIDKG
ncbi:MAG: transporter substrate-binding domain-containing protein, partial [Vicingaceae bacterium]|nr:transporter substrate-binding domain-containing protein [Vicingaceae bacterium]